MCAVPLGATAAPGAEGGCGERFSVTSLLETLVKLTHACEVLSRVMGKVTLDLSQIKNPIQLGAH